MANIHELRIRIDRDQPIEPQVIYWRHQGVPWAMLVKLSGKPRRRLQKLVARWVRDQARAVVSPQLLEVLKS